MLVRTDTSMHLSVLATVLAIGFALLVSPIMPATADMVVDDETVEFTGAPLEYQARPQVAIDSAGNIVVLWQNYGDLGANGPSQWIGQTFGAANTSITLDPQDYFQLTLDPLALGQFVLTRPTVDGLRWEVRNEGMERVGEPAEVRCRNAFGGSGRTDTDGESAFCVSCTWQTNNFSIRTRFRCFEPLAGITHDYVQIDPIGSFDQRRVAMVVETGQTLWLAWSQDGTLVARRFTFDGVPLTPLTVLTESFPYSGRAVAAVNPAGDFAIGYTELPKFSECAVGSSYFQVVRSDGSLAGPRTPIGSGGRDGSLVTDMEATPDAGFLLAYSDDVGCWNPNICFGEGDLCFAAPYHDYWFSTAFLAEFDPDGQPVNPRISLHPEGAAWDYQLFPSIEPIAPGQLLVLWADGDGQGTGYMNLFGRIVYENEDLATPTVVVPVAGSMRSQPTDGKADDGDSKTEDG